ncbi:MAG: CynX/NimT family MFS transporter [Peptococcaceae bacterium]
MPKKWLVFLAVYLGSVAATLNQFKVPPLMETLMNEFQLSPGIAGWLMSCFGAAGLLLAIPLGMVLKIARIRSIGASGLAALAGGALLGALAPGVKVLLLGRLLEGIGLLTMGIAAPAVISVWFAKPERDLPMGIWTTWIPAGSVMMFNLAEPLYNLGNWRTVWWFGFGAAAIALILYLWFVKLPEGGPDLGEDEKNGLKMLASGRLWLLALMFTIYSFILVSYTSWAPLYLRQNFMLTPSSAAFYTSLIHLGVIPANILAGLVIQKINSYRKVYLSGFGVLSILTVMAFNLQRMVIPFYMLALGLAAGFIATAIFAAVPEVGGAKSSVALATSTIIGAQNLGLLLGPALVGKISAGGNWQNAGFLFMAITVSGAVIGWFNKVP